MRKKVTIVSTKSITVNRFLDQIIIDLFAKYDLTVICKDPKNLQINKAINTEKVIMPVNFKDFINPLKTIFSIYQLRLLFKNSDCVYLHTPLAAHLSRIAIFTMLKKPIVIYHVHGLRYISGNWNLKSFIFRVIEFVLSKLTNCFICINETDFRSLSKYNKKSKIKKIMGVGVHIKSKKNIIKNLDKRKKFIVGTIASYRKEKGYEQLLEVASHFNGSDNIIFKTFGYGNKKWLVKKAQKYKLQNLLINDFTEFIEEEIENFNLYFLPSLREGLNVSIQECLARGIPVITTKVRGCEDLIIEGFNGYCYEPNNISNAIKLILKIKDMSNIDYKLISKNSFLYAKRNLNRKNLSKEICETFKKYV